MKIITRTLIILSLALIYCVSVNVLSCNKLLLCSELSSSSNKELTFLKTLNSLDNGFQSGKANFSLKIIPRLFTRILSPVIFGLYQYREIIIYNPKTTYFSYSKLLFCSFKEPDIIFPFHYFW